MAKIFNRVAFQTPTTGVGSVNVGAAVNTSVFTPAEAGAQDGDTNIPYLIEDGNDVEIGLGTFNDATPDTFDRNTVTQSKIAGVAGAAKINLSGSAEVRFIADAPRLERVQRKEVSISSTISVSNTTFVDVMTQAITPKSTDNLIDIYGHIYMGASSTDSYAYVRLLRDATEIGNGVNRGSTVGPESHTGPRAVDNINQLYPMPFRFRDAPGVTTEIIYKVQIVRAFTGTVYVNRTGADGLLNFSGRGRSSMWVEEIAGI